MQSNSTIILSNGQTVAVPPGANPIIFRRIEETKLFLAANPKPKRKATRRASNGKASKKSNYAKMQSVIAGATMELVERVNGLCVSCQFGNHCGNCPCCRGKAIPNSWYTVNRGEFTASVDRKTNEVSYKDE
jgi:hypothetical protein